MSTYTPVGVIRDELRAEIIRRAEESEFDTDDRANLRGTFYNPLVSMKDDHSRFCLCEEHFGTVDWDGETRHNARFGQRPPFAWAGGSA